MFVLLSVTLEIQQFCGDIVVYLSKMTTNCYKSAASAEIRDWVELPLIKIKTE